MVRCIYREAGTSLADEEETVGKSLDENRVKVKVEMLFKSDPAQLFEKVEIQAREYVQEVKVRLVKYLTSCPLSPRHAREFFTMLLEEYQAFSRAFAIMKPFFSKLDFEHLKEFGLSYDHLHKHLFYTEIYQDPAVHGNLRGLVTQLRLGAESQENSYTDKFEDLLRRYPNFNGDPTEISFTWKESDQAFKLYKAKQAQLREKSGLAKIDWEDDPSSVEWKTKVFKKPTQQRCQCGHCSALSSPLDSPVSMLPPFKPANTSHTKCCTCIPDAPVSSKWSNPAIGVPAFNPHLLISNDLHSIPPSQLLAPPPSLMMNGLGSGVPCGDSLEQREVEKSSEQSSGDRMADCQCSKCSFHRGKDHETKLKAENSKSFTAHTTSLLPSSNHVHNNHRQPTPPSLLQRTLEDPPRDIHSYLLDSSLRHVNYNGYHDNLIGCGEIDDDDDVENSLSDSDFDNEGDEGVDYDDRRRSCSPRRASQSSDIDALGGDVIPGSPCSVRSSGDGSSCDTPPVHDSASSTEDGRTERGKYCDCCYCEFFGHAAPPVAPTSHNYTEMRDKLRMRLNSKRQPNQPLQEDKKANAPIVDHRSLDDLLTFINGEDEKQGTRSKSQKKARQKQKKVVEKAKQKQTPDTQNNGKGSPSSSSTCCEKVNGVHQNGADVVLQSRHTSEQSQQRKNHVTNGKEEKKPAQQKKTEPQQQGKQPEVSNEGCASRKKLSHADQEVAMSRQDSRKTCNGKENNVLSRRKVEEKSKKKRQEPVAPVSVSVSVSVSVTAPEPATVEKNDVDKSKCGGRKQQQKKQGKKKVSLDDVFLPREDIEIDKLTQMDEAERELEEFKRFCMNLTPLERRERIPVNVNLKGLLNGRKNGSS